MKTKITKLLMLTTIMVVITFAESCKKGDGDPSISLRSRKARVVGEWVIDNWVDQSSNTTTNNDNGSITSSSGTNNLTINGTNILITSSQTSSGGTLFSTNGSGVVSAKMTFEKDGSFTRNIQYSNMNYTQTYSGSTTTYTRSSTMQISGTWNFLGGIEEDYKNKERIILNILQSTNTDNYIYPNGTDTYTTNQTNTYANGQNTEVWQLTTLKNKLIEMEAITNNTGTSNYTDYYSGFTDTGSDNSTATGSIKGTLIIDK
jgi:hypothetical protein